ncbi:MAG: phosphatase PAP2 family protein [Actinobacteria bacterium]|nr:phosphatase PAP2 family protein [Actinomycetota bacterium]
MDAAARLDAGLYAALAQRRSPRLDVAMRRLSHAADYSRLSLGSAAVLALVGGPRGRSAALQGLAGVGVTATLVNLAVKPLTRRARPDRDRYRVPETRHVRMPISTSFPSGHTAAAVAFATGAARVWPATGVPLGALALAVGYSRVHTGVHYPGDVLAGGLIGAGLALLTSRALDDRS